MELFMRLKTTFITVPFLLITAVSASPQKQLAQVNQEVNGAKQIVQRLHSERQQKIYRLQQIEVKYSRLKTTYDKTSMLMTGLQQQLDTLKIQQNNLKQKLAQQYLTLNKQISAAYMLGHEPLFKLLLTEQDPNTINRKQTYLYYLTDAQVHFIEKIRQTKADLQNTETDLAAQQTKLQQYAAKQQQRMLPLQKLLKQR